MKTRKKIIRVLFVSVVTIVVFFLIINKMRNFSSSISFARNFYAYFSVEIPLLDYWIKYVDTHNYYSYGFSFVSGIIANLMNVLGKNNITIPAYQVNELLNYNLVDHFIRVFPDQKYNAYVSMFFAFYLDFREFGVIVGSFIYGFILAKLYNRAMSNYCAQLFYLLYFYSLLTSFIRWQFIIVSYVFSYFILGFLVKSDKRYR